MARKRRSPLAATSLDAAVRELLEAPPLRNPNAEPERAVREFIAAVAHGQSPAPLLLHWVAERLEAISREPAHPARPAFGLRKRGRGRPAEEQRKNEQLFYMALARVYGHSKDDAIDLAVVQFRRKGRKTAERLARRTRAPSADISPEDVALLEATLLSWGISLPPRPDT